MKANVNMVVVYYSNYFGFNEGIGECISFGLKCMKCLDGSNPIIILILCILNIKELGRPIPIGISKLIKLIKSYFSVKYIFLGVY